MNPNCKYDIRDLDELDIPWRRPEWGQVNIGVPETMKRTEDNERLLRDMVKRQADDNVNHPGHYTFGDIEVIDYIRDKLTPEEFQGYCTGNVLKYVSRYRHKNGVEDLKKAQVYLGWLIESLEKGAEE